MLFTVCFVNRSPFPRELFLQTFSHLFVFYAWHQKAACGNDELWLDSVFIYKTSAGLENVRGWCVGLEIQASSQLCAPPPERAAMCRPGPAACGEQLTVGLRANFPPPHQRPSTLYQAFVGLGFLVAVCHCSLKRTTAGIYIYSTHTFQHLTLRFESSASK